MAQIPNAKTEPSTQEEIVVCQNLLTAVLENATAQKSAISLRTVAGLKAIPTGSCIQALATRIQTAEMVAPMTVSQVEARWKPRFTLFHPKNMTAMKVASIKKARIPSIASGAPKISPTSQL